MSQRTILPLSLSRPTATLCLLPQACSHTPLLECSVHGWGCQQVPTYGVGHGCVPPGLHSRALTDGKVGANTLLRGMPSNPRFLCADPPGKNAYDSPAGRAETQRAPVGEEGSRGEGKGCQIPALCTMDDLPKHICV